MHQVVSPDAPVNTAPKKLNLTPGANSSDDIDIPALDAPSTPELSRTLLATKSIIGFWKGVVALLVAGYQAGFLWVSAVGIYLLLRRDIDGVQTGEVFVDQAEEYGMPPLADDPATGVPETAPHAPAVPGDAGPQPA